MERKLSVGLAVLTAAVLLAMAVWLPGCVRDQYGRLDYWLSHEPNARDKVQAVSAFVQAAAAVLGLVVSMELAMITLAYVLLTRKLAKATAGQLESSLFPMLQFDFEEANGSIGRINVRIRNTGQVAIKIVFCAFGGKLYSVMHPTAGGDVRFESVELKELAGTILASGGDARQTVDLRPKGVPQTEWGSLLMHPREYVLRLNCTDPRGVVKHSFVRRGDKRVEYKPDFVKPQ